MADGTELGLKVLAAVKGSGQIYGAAHIIEILRGMQSEKLLKDDLSLGKKQQKQFAKQ